MSSGKVKPLSKKSTVDIIMNICLQYTHAETKEIRMRAVPATWALYHGQAALRMSVSGTTFGRILGQARRKVAEALIQGKALRIEGPK
jgi:predicted DNA-binding protein (UPF0251 family)